jgi:hypothetical protein
MVSPFTIAPLEHVLDEATRKLPMGATVVVVAAYLHDSLSARIVRLAQRGHPVALLWVADEPPPPLSGVRVYNVSGPMRTFERAWVDQGVAGLTPPASAAAARPAEPRPSTGETARNETDPVTRWARPPGGS